MAAFQILRSTNFFKGSKQVSRATISLVRDRCCDSRPDDITANIELKPFSDIPTIARNNLLAVVKMAPRMKDSHIFQDELHEKHGPIIRGEIAGNQSIFLCDPTAIEALLRTEGKYPRTMSLPVWNQQREDIGEDLGVFFSQGEHWYKMRKHANKVLLNTQKIANTSPSVNTATTAFVSHLRSLRQQDSTVVLNNEVSKWTLASVCQVLFEHEFGCFSSDPPEDTKNFIKSVHTFMEMNNILIFLPPFLARTIFRKKNEMATEAQRTVFNIARSNVDKKITELEHTKCQAGSENGFLSELVELAFHKDHNLSKKELYANVIDLMTAAIDTTTNATLFLLYEISKRVDIQERIYEEINKVAPNGELPSAQMLQNTPLLRACVKETLRLYPVGNGITRVLKEDTVILGYKVPSGTVVLIPLYTMGRREQYYKNADKFIPERWLRDSAGTRNEITNHFTSLPFGFGARMCIGRRFAELEMHTLLFQMIQQFRIHNACTSPVSMVSRIILAPSSDIRVTLEDRR